MDGTQIPRRMLGTDASVARFARSLAMKAVGEGGWASALKDEEWIDIRQTTGRIILQGPAAGAGRQSMPLYHFLVELMQVCKNEDRDLWYQRQRDLIITGVSEFWFALACLGMGPWLIVTDRMFLESNVTSTTALRALFSWWEDFCQVQHRFSWTGLVAGNSSLWMARAFSLAKVAGVPEVKLEQFKRASPYTVKSTVLAALPSFDEIGPGAGEGSGVGEG